MAILNNGIFCDHVKQKSPGSPEKNCNKKAAFSITTMNGARLDYCTKCLSAGVRQNTGEIKIRNI